MASAETRRRMSAKSPPTFHHRRRRALRSAFQRVSIRAQIPARAHCRRSGVICKRRVGGAQRRGIRMAWVSRTSTSCCVKDEHGVLRNGGGACSELSTGIEAQADGYHGIGASAKSADSSATRAISRSQSRYQVARRLLDADRGLLSRCCRPSDAHSPGGARTVARMAAQSGLFRMLEQRCCRSAREGVGCSLRHRVERQREARRLFIGQNDVRTETIEARPRALLCTDWAVPATCWEPLGVEAGAR